MKTFLGLLLLILGAAGLIGMKGLGDADQAFGCGAVLVLFIVVLLLLQTMSPA